LELEAVVLEVKEFLDTLARPLHGSTIFEALAAVRNLRLRTGLRLQDSLNLFDWIYKLASTYEPERESFEEALDRVGEAL
jgi:hypothetical protein